MIFSQNKNELLKLSGKPIIIKSSKSNNVLELEKSLKVTGNDFIIESQKKNSKISILGSLNINNSDSGDLTFETNNRKTNIKFDNDKLLFNQNLDTKSSPEFIGLDLNNGRLTNLGSAKHKYDAVNFEFMTEYVEDRFTQFENKPIEKDLNLKAKKNIIFDTKIINFNNSDIINLKDPEKGGSIITTKFFEKIIKKNKKSLDIINDNGSIDLYSNISEFNFNSKNNSFLNISQKRSNVIFDNQRNTRFTFINSKEVILTLDEKHVLFNKKILFPEKSFIDENDGDLELSTEKDILFNTEKDIIFNTEKNIKIHEDATLRFGNDSYLFSKADRYFDIFSKQDLRLKSDKDIYIDTSDNLFLKSEKGIIIDSLDELIVNANNRINFESLDTITLKTADNIFLDSNVTITGTLNVELDIDSQEKITNLGILRGLVIDTLQNIDMGGNKVKNIGEPIISSDAATKHYIDSEVQKIKLKDSAKVVQFDILNAYYIETTKKLISNNAGALIIDGYSVLENDRVVIAGQKDKDQNGIYTVIKLGSNTTKWELTRSPDFNDLIEINPNVLISIERGTLHKDSLLSFRSDKIEGISGNNNPNNFIEFVKYSGLGASAVDNVLSLKKVLKTPEPIPNYSKLYIRDDGKVYILDSKGIETCLLDNKNNIDEDNEINIWNMMNDNIGISYPDLIFKGVIKEKFHIDDHISFTYQSSTPIAEENQTKLFSKNDGKLYIIDHEGNESSLIKEDNSTANISGNLTIGSTEAQSDLKIYGNSDNNYFMWHGSENLLEINGTLDVNGTSKTNIHAFNYQSSTPSAETDHLNLYSKNDGYLYSIDSSSREKKIKSMLTDDINLSTLEITITTNTSNSIYDLYKNTEYGLKIHKIIATTNTDVSGVSDMDIINSTTGNTIVDNTYFDPTISNSSFYYQSNGTLTNDSVNQNDQISVKFNANPTNSVTVKFIIYFVLT